MTSGQDFRLAFCVPSMAINNLTGATKTVQLTMFKNSKKNGYEELMIEKMNEGDFMPYF